MGTVSRDRAGEPAASETSAGAGEAPPMSRLAITLVVAAMFGAGMAMVVPLAFSLALRLDQIAPGDQHLLGYVLGAGQATMLIAAPITGVLSDRARTRWGRRRPFTVAGLLIGLAAIPVLALATSLQALTIGWILTTLGWGTAGASIGNLLADRLPRRQRGTVSGLANFAGQVAPVVGILAVGQFASDSWLLFAIPGGVGGLLVLIFVALMPEADASGLASPGALSWRALMASYVFDPRRYPDFAWAWLGRFIFFFGLALSTSFGTYFYAQRLGVEVEDVAPTVALMSAAGVIAGSAGAAGAGWASDRFGTRRMWTAAGAVVFAFGSLVNAAAHSLAPLAVGAVLFSLGLAIFSAVGGALTMDILPERDSQAGRYLGINSFSQKVPAAVAPLVAPSIIMMGPGDEPAYGLLYIVTAVLALVGAAVIAARVDLARGGA